MAAATTDLTGVGWALVRTAAGAPRAEGGFAGAG